MRECTFTVHQQICVQVPITFGATATATSAGIVCGTPTIGLCGEDVGCTHTIGFYRNDSIITDALITAAGGTIILGQVVSNVPQGLTFIVDTTNANAVLSLNTPLPPTLTDPSRIAQYRQLYAQLLAAKLNVLNGATCDAAAAAIAAADAFLASSPPEGTDDAPDFQEPLELFNSGGAPGCPMECSD